MEWRPQCGRCVCTLLARTVFQFKQKSKVLTGNGHQLSVCLEQEYFGSNIWDQDEHE